jgi:hypothetical protein
VAVAEPTPALDASARAALEKLADIAAPHPVSFVPQTWGWVVLAIFIVLLAVWVLLRWYRHRKANRYRAEALAELASIERAIEGNAAPGAALAAIPPILKRVALAAWPRSRVAALAQSRWVNFVAGAEGEGALPAPLVRLLDDAEYRPPKGFAAVSPEDARACARAARHWIDTHRVSA